MNKLSYLKKKVFFNGKNHFYSGLNFFLEMDKFAHFKNKNVLDIGCGDGKQLILYKLIGNTKFSWGIDLAAETSKNKDVLNTLKRNIEVLNLKNMNILRGDILTYDFEEKRFDIITAINSLHHIIVKTENLLRDKEAQNSFIDYFKKIYNLLNKGGIFILHEIARNNLKIGSYYYQKVVKTKFKVNYTNKHSVKEYSITLKRSGFNNVFVRYYYPSYYLNKFKFLFSNPIVAFLINSPFFIFAFKT